ncbi:hypothetical protein [Paenibacillus ginsengarvi]|uniref:TM2 domain-containing protein n=1 Tax=Paenibacillus ginsengarvi TaxID=400777 RepID=A0A3B0BF70_9BACL|nr:hypothetical protein [Paenibacillus ginsengarvi]RKN71835.1 hypothetical protein D7M11_28805 [Paenibacillus ginsengarvi]
MDDSQQRGPEGSGGRHAESERRETSLPDMARPHGWDPYNPYQSMTPRKRKWVAVLLSLFIPGTGHFYLGLMQKGLMIMLLIILDIFAIVHFSINMSSIPLITLLGLFLPIIYFYSLFDALLLTDKVNRHAFMPPAAADRAGEAHGESSARPGSAPLIGWLLVGLGGLFFVFSAKPDWIRLMMNKMGTMIGGLVLIGIGIVLFLRNSSKPK